MNLWQSCLKQLKEVGIIPGGEFSLGLNSPLMGPLILGKIHGNLAKQGDILGPMVGSDAGLVFVEANVQTPVQSIFDRSVTTNHFREYLGIQHVAENVLWGAERIRGELLKLGIRVAKLTIQTTHDQGQTT